eukprot:scaffold13584_cov78-Skeletonema_dohrnii-CCMP3373.AAC.1
MASPGRLRCCSDADTSNKYLSREKDASILSWPTVMSHWKLWTSSKTAVQNLASSGHLRRCSDADTSNKYLSREKDASILSWPTREIRYGARVARLDSEIWPHQVTYDVVATPIRPTTT